MQPLSDTMLATHATVVIEKFSSAAVRRRRGLVLCPSIGNVMHDPMHDTVGVCPCL